MSYKIEKQENGKYKIRVWGNQDVFGKVKTKQVSNISSTIAAKKLAQEIELELNDNSQSPDFSRKADITFAKLEQLYYEERENKVSPTTLHNSFKYNRQKVLDYMQDIKARNVNTTIVQKFIDQQQKLNLKKKTVKNYVSYILAVINWGVNNDFLEYNRIKKLNYIDDEEEFEATTLSIEQVVDVLISMKKTAITSISLLLFPF